MNIHKILFVYFGLTMLSSGGHADDLMESATYKYDQNEKKKTNINVKKNSERYKNAFKKLTYSPPMLGAPSNNRLVGMALRGSTNNLLLSVLAPEHTGFSMKAQPNIYWYTSKPILKPFLFVEFVLNSDLKTKPILRTHLKPVTQGGIQKLSLSDYNITLVPNVEYTWAISLVPDLTTRSYDFVTSGKIKHVVASDQLHKAVSATQKNLHSYVFAKAGYWYDALAEIIEQTESNPKELASLLKQVELDQIAKNLKSVSPD